MEQIQRELNRIIYEIYGQELVAQIAVAPEGTGADYATNIAMQLARVARKSPLLIAEEIKQGLLENGKCDDVEVAIAAPGFLNFRFKDDYFVQQVQRIRVAIESESMAELLQSDWRNKMVITEFSDPNPFKVLHVGHLYTSIIGDAISRLFEMMGARVKRVNFGGDVGLHVSKTLYALWYLDFLRSLENEGREVTGGKREEEFERFLANLTIEQIARCYVEGSSAYEEVGEAQSEIKRLNRLIYRVSEMGRTESEILAGDDGRLAKIYWRGRELSYDYFKDFYRQIGVHFDKFYPESTVVEKGVAEVREHIGSVYEESEGAIVYHGEKNGLHTRVFINREGVPTYETKDVGLIFTKWHDWRFDKSVVITGNEQKDYMSVVLSSVAEYAPELVERTSHLTHGLVKLKGGVKMSSRKGNFLKAVDVIEMVRDAFLGRSEKSEKQVANLPASQESEKIVLAAVKYAFLRYKMGGEIIFDPQESVSMSGNSGVYLLYSAVRAKKILQKLEKQTGREPEYNTKVGQSEIESRAERSLNKKIAQYEEVLRVAVREMTPHLVCAYLYELAQDFSRFYEHVQVAGSAREAERGDIMRAYLAVMEHGLGKILGIEIPEEM